MTRLLPASALVLALAVTLTGCIPGGPAPSTSGSSTPTSTESATPTPEPETAPARADLELSPEGMGTLVFGEAPSTDPATQMLVLDAEWCTDANTGNGVGIVSGDPEAARWVPIPAYRTGRESDFMVDVSGGLLSRIDLQFISGVIPTTEGVRVGDARAAVEAAYPSASVVHSGLTDIYVVTGTHGTLQMEVSTTDPYWAGFRPADVVVFIHATETGVAPFSVAASENIAGICPF